MGQSEDKFKLIEGSSSPEHQNEGGHSEKPLMHAAEGLGGNEAVSSKLSQNLMIDIMKFRQKDRSGSSDTIQKQKGEDFNTDTKDTLPDENASRKSSGDAFLKALADSRSQGDKAVSKGAISSTNIGDKKMLKNTTIIPKNFKKGNYKLHGSQNDKIDDYDTEQDTHESEFKYDGNTSHNNSCENQDTMLDNILQKSECHQRSAKKQNEGGIKFLR